MSQSLVISFRAGGDFLNRIESQRLEGESVSQAAQRLLRELLGVSTGSVYASTFNNTEVVDIVDKAVDPVLERIAAIEERLGKVKKTDCMRTQFLASEHHYSNFYICDSGNRNPTKIFDPQTNLIA
jgi:hypothetical protein